MIFEQMTYTTLLLDSSSTVSIAATIEPDNNMPTAGSQSVTYGGKKITFLNRKFSYFLYLWPEIVATGKEPSSASATDSISIEVATNATSAATTTESSTTVFVSFFLNNKILQQIFAHLIFYYSLDV
jgi:hypothetical protein